MNQYQYSAGGIAKLHLALAVAAGALLAVQLALPAVQAQDKSQTASVPSSSPPSQNFEREGVAVELAVEPVETGKGSAGKLLAGTKATIRLKITETNAGKAINNLRPAAWIDVRDAGVASDARTCREKVQSFLQSGFSRRPTIDLNAYFILTLNNEPNISVIDPMSGFGGTKLYTLVGLPSPGEDWVMSSDKKRLYVSMPLSNQVAVVDVPTWKVIANLDAGVNPARLALQNDGKYLWVGNDAPKDSESGVTIIDTATLKVAAQLNTGMGHHEIAFTPDDRTAFITNKQSGTLTVVDVRRFARAKDMPVGPLPAALAFSALSQAIYVAGEGDGTVVAIDGVRFETLARLATAPGIRTFRISPGGRYGFAVNQTTNVVYIFDLATHRLVHTVPVGPKPDQITFTEQFAYVRARDSEFITMINLPALGKEAAVSRFPAGQKAPQESRADSLGEAIVPAPEAGAVLVANPADKMIYFYTEGMAAPMGSFQNYRREPRAILVLNNSLRETEPGIYSAPLQLAGAGSYDVVFLLDAPRLVHCFSLTIAENPDLPKQAGIPIKVNLLPGDTAVRVGKPYKLRFSVVDSITSKPKSDLQDMGVLVFLAPGIWQQREFAKPVGDGVYEMSFVPPQAGVYYVFFRCPSLSVTFSQVPQVTLTATKDDSGSEVK